MKTKYFPSILGLTALLTLNLPSFHNLVGFGLAHATGLNDTDIKTCSNATQNSLPYSVTGFSEPDAEYSTNDFNSIFWR